jgi:hypothetical protein
LSPISSSSSSFCVFLSHLPLRIHCSHHFYYQCLTQCCLLISLPRYLRSLFSVSYCVSCCSSCSESVSHIFCTEDSGGV